MKTIDIEAPAASLADAVRDLGGEPTLLTEAGRPVAVLLPVQGADLETVSLRLNPRFLAILDESRRRQEAEGGVSGEDMRRRLGIKPARTGRSKAGDGTPGARQPSKKVKREQ